MNKQIINKLVKLANHLDKKGLTREANLLDSVIKLAVPMEPGVDEGMEKAEKQKKSENEFNNFIEEVTRKLSSVLEGSPMDWKKENFKYSILWSATRDNFIDEYAKACQFELDLNQHVFQIRIKQGEQNKVIFRADKATSYEDQLRDLEQSLPSISKVVSSPKMFKSVIWE